MIRGASFSATYHECPNERKCKSPFGGTVQVGYHVKCPAFLSMDDYMS